MLVILTEQQVLSTKQVCSNCLLADSGGLPRWRKGKLGCGRLLEDRAREKPLEDCKETQSCCDLPQVYECQMGFRVTNIG